VVYVPKNGLKEKSSDHEGSENGVCIVMELPSMRQLRSIYWEVDWRGEERTRPMILARRMPEPRPAIVRARPAS